MKIFHISLHSNTSVHSKKNWTFNSLPPWNEKVALWSPNTGSLLIIIIAIILFKRYSHHLFIPRTLSVGHPIKLWKFKTWCYTFCGLCRCECFGHAATYRNVEGSEGQLGTCVCDCHPSTNTEGENVCWSTLNNNYYDYLLKCLSLLWEFSTVKRFCQRVDVLINLFYWISLKPRHLQLKGICMSFAEYMYLLGAWM